MASGIRGGAHRMIELDDGSRTYPVYPAGLRIQKTFGAPKNFLNDSKPAVDAVIRVLKDSQLRKELRNHFEVQIDNPTSWAMPLYEFATLCRRYQIPLPILSP